MYYQFRLTSRFPVIFLRYDVACFQRVSEPRARIPECRAVITKGFTERPPTDRLSMVPATDRYGEGRGTRVITSRHHGAANYPLGRFDFAGNIWCVTTVRCDCNTQKIFL